MAATYLDVAGARALAAHLHEGQVDKQGRDYFTYHLAVVAHVTPLALHLCSAHRAGDDLGCVAAELATDGIDLLSAAVQGAWLHDAVEDTAATLTSLVRAGVHPIIVDAIESVTRRDTETYRDLIVRSQAHPLGRLIKLADNATNLAAGRRWGSPTAKRLAAERYVPARARLAESAGLGCDALEPQIVQAERYFIGVGC